MGRSSLYERLFELACRQDLDGVLERTLDLVLEETGAERGFVVTPSPDGSVVVRAARGLDDAPVSGPGHRPSRTVVRQAFQERRAVRVSRALEASELGERDSVRRHALQSILAVPVTASAEVAAVVCVDTTRPDAFDHGVEARLEELSEPLGAVVHNASRVQTLETQGRRLARRVGDGEGPSIIGESSALRASLDLVGRAAATSAPVLLLGETGSGKELLAREVHRRSGRSGPLVTVNCAALPEQLIEAELFGHAAGAFTGATGERAGRFAAAHEGTLFLDEVGELSGSAQARFLRALESGEIQRVGDDRSQRVDVRVVAATHRDLRATDSDFREDLYYRLAVVTVRVPPLRERPEDVPALAEAFALEAALELGRRIEGLAADAVAALRAHSWPGNVRELKNAIRRATIFARGRLLEARDLPFEVREESAAAGPTAPPALPPVARRTPRTWDELQDARREAILDLERAFTADLLERSGGNVSKAAREAGLSRPSFYELLDRVGLSPADFRRRR